ncbi:amidase family protein [Nocardioides sp. WV_118_6]
MTDLTPTPTDEIGWLSATEIAAAVRSRRLRVADIAEAMIERVERINPAVNALVWFDPEQVRRDAAALDAAQDTGAATGPLHGVPFTIKDLTAVAGVPLTFGMKPLRDNIADHDAVIVERLTAAGGLFLGKTNTPESGYKGATDNHLFGATHNPWRPGHTAGGSSGGAGAAVAAGLGPLAEASDGGGSVRIPASLCGVVGVKPSTGRIPQTILPGRFYSWAYHGPITRTVADAALMLDVVSGPDPRDPLSLPDRVDFTAAIADRDLTGVRVAWSSDLGLGIAVDPEIEKLCRTAVEALAAAGAIVEEATPDWGGADPQTAMWNGIWVPGFASEHDLLDWASLRGEVDDELIELIAEGERLTGVDIGRADAARGVMWDAFARFLGRYDVLVSPTVATPAFPHGQFAPDHLAGRPLREQLLGWFLTYPFNLLTTPAMSVPAGFTPDGCPVGLQLATGLHQDALLLRAAAVLEERAPWAQHCPPACR